MSKQPGSIKQYVIGFILSLLCTLIPYEAVNSATLSRPLVLTSLAVFAVLQVLIQLVFFLHLGREPRPRLQRMAFMFMTGVVIIVVFGTLWIMNNLDYHAMSPQETDQYIRDEEAIDPSNAY